MKLDIGTGVAEDGWTSVDLHEPADLRRAMDDLYGIFDHEIEAVRSSHALEHVPGAQVPRVLAEWHRVMAPGAPLWLMVPTLDYCCRYWLDHHDAWGMQLLFGLQSGPGQEHKTGFTPGSLERVVALAGFVQVSVRRVRSHNQICLLCEARA